MSVIIPAYNEESRIDQCIETLMHLDYPHHEIIIVDDCSSDKTIKRAMAYKIKLIRQVERKGPAAARNLGAKDAKGEVLAFTDADCIVQTSWLRSLVEPMVHEDEIACVGGPILPSNPTSIMEESLSNLYRTFLCWGTGIGRCSRTEGNISYGPVKILGGNFAVRRHVFDKLEGLNEFLLSNEDQEFSMRIYRSGWKIAYVPYAAIYHSRHLTFLMHMRRFFRYGVYWAICNVKYRYTLSLPHILLPVMFVFLLILRLSPFSFIALPLILMYSLFMFLAGVQAVAKAGKIRLLITVPLIGLVIQLSYTLGYLLGLPKSIFIGAKRNPQ